MTDHRERLVSPLALTLVTLGFAVAFIALAPSLDEISGNALPVDDLSVAYLKARADSDALSDDEAFAAMIALAQADKRNAAQALLDTRTAWDFDVAQRVLLNIEMTAAEFRLASATDAGNATDVARLRLAENIASLLARPALHDPKRLARAAELSLSLDKPSLSAEVYRRLANLEANRATHWLTLCGRILSTSSSNRDVALACFDAARVASKDRGERFSLGLEMLALSPRQSALERELLTDEAAGIEDRKSLADIYLSNERPLDAAGVYANLANVEASQRAHWLNEAARWAEAADRPADAAVYLDRMSADLTAEERPAHRRRIEALLLGAGKIDAALRSVAIRLAEQGDQATLLRMAVDLARQTGRNEQALDWNTRLVAAAPDDDAALENQIALSMALGRLDVARDAARATVSRHPDDSLTRESLAQIEEWRGQPERAFTQWRRLAASAPTRVRLFEVARLAELLRYPAVAADARLSLARSIEPDAESLVRIAELYELDGRPEAAADALNEIMRLYGESAHRLHALAALHKRHVRYDDALDAWNRFAVRFGRSSDETLARMELHWRIGEPDTAAAVASALENVALSGPVSDYQASLLAEIAWRYRKPGLAAVSRTLLSAIDDTDQRTQHGRRSIDALIGDGEAPAARRLAERLWHETGDSEFALTALRLAVSHDEPRASRRLLLASEEVEDLRAWPEYWSLRAALSLREGEPGAAERAYQTAIDIDPANGEALSGLLWLLIGQDDAERIAAFLVRYRHQADAQPSLFAAFAIGHLQVGDSESSLPWFERALVASQNDYGFVLTYADALQASGRVDRALAVRRHAVNALRPHLLDGVVGQREALLQQYGRVLARYGSADDNEAWLNYVLNTALAHDGDADFWREDMAISWLMATDRHEHARLIMARRHEQRLQAPLWQDMALAMRVDDQDSIEAMLNAGTGLSDGNRILALRQLGRDGDAFALALRTLAAPRSSDDRSIALDQYADLSRYRPRDIVAGTRATSTGELSMREHTVAARHTFAAGRFGSSSIFQGVGVGLELVRREFAIDDGVQGASDNERDVSVSLFRETSRESILLRAGLVGSDTQARTQAGAHYARRYGRGRHELTVDLALNETADESPELRLAGQRDRIGVGMGASLGERHFARLSAEATELSEQASRDRFSRGLRSSAEIGVRGAFGGLDWSSSVSAENVNNDRVDVLPASLRVASTSTLDNVLAKRASAVSLNGSIARGDLDSAYPRAASLRYFLNAGLGHAWPSKAFGLQLDAGAGIRVLGNDELGFRLSRGARLGTRNAAGDATSFAVDYRYRF